MQQIATSHGCGHFDFAADEDEQRTLWSARKESLWSMLALRNDGDRVWSTDVAVPLSRLADLVEVSKRELDELRLVAGVLGHVGDGNFHESILFSETKARDRAGVERCIASMVERALDMEGTCSGEHGIGLGKKASLAKELGEPAIALMRALKAAVDPLWLLNPGKIFDVPDMV